MAITAISGIMASVTGALPSVVTGSIVAGVLSPVAKIFTAVTIVPVTVAVAVLWGMTTKGPDSQSWGLSDYAVILPIALVLTATGNPIGKITSAVMP